MIISLYIHFVTLPLAALKDWQGAETTWLDNCVFSQSQGLWMCVFCCLPSTGLSIGRHFVFGASALSRVIWLETRTSMCNPDFYHLLEIFRNKVPNRLFKTVICMQDEHSIEDNLVAYIFFLQFLISALIVAKNPTFSQHGSFLRAESEGWSYATRWQLMKWLISIWLWRNNSSLSLSSFSLPPLPPSSLSRFPARPHGIQKEAGRWRTSGQAQHAFSEKMFWGRISASSWSFIWNAIAGIIWYVINHQPDRKPSPALSRHSQERFP